MTPQQRVVRARIAALHSHMGYEPGERTKHLRAGLERYFYRQAMERCGPGASDAAIAATTVLLRKAHYARLSAAGVEARQRKAG